MVRDEAWYEHTWQGRLIIWYANKRDWWRRRPEALAWWVAFHLPRRVVLFALVRIAAGTIGDPAERPGLMNAYVEMSNLWEAGRGR